MKPSSKKKTKAPSAEEKQKRSALLDGLDSSDEKLRLEACTSIASKFEPQSSKVGEEEETNAALEASHQKEILLLGKDGMFTSLVKCARDATSPIIRLSAIGAMRNISIMGGARAVALMQQADCWSALLDAIELGDAKNEEMDVALKRESLRVMDSLCENSSAVAERRLPDSLDRLAQPCFTGPKVAPHVLEDAAKLLFRATQNNMALAQAMATTDAGKRIGSKLEEMTGSFAVEGRILASAYALGALMNLCLLSQQMAVLPQLVRTWLANVRRDLLHPAGALPELLDEDQIVKDALELEENDMDLDGKPKLESDQLQNWLDRVQAQTIVLEVFTELLQQGDAMAIAPLREENHLATCLQLACTLWNRESVGPNVLLFPVATLQQAGADCAAAAIEAGFPLPLAADLVFAQLVQVLGQITLRRETSERAIALANCLLAVAKCFPQQLALPQQLLDQVVLMQTQCKVVPVRALLAHVLAALAGRSLPLLPPIASALLHSAKEDTSLVVVCQVMDVLLDLFSADEVQPVLSAIPGCMEVFQGFVSRFDRRFTEWKRKEGADEEDESVPASMHEAKENVTNFIQWRRSLNL